ncbi:MAG: recombinase family protein [Deltaproteobacteria bacterium]|nr:recombinase family protein [Deltaproteobacteria bacterium]
MKTAVAYVGDIILGRTGEVIGRSYQRELIRRHADEAGIEIVAWFEDEMYNEDVLMRPGVQALLAFGRPYDMVLCERVWALSRSMAVLEVFFKELDRRGLNFGCATTMWDCTSQKVRRRFSPSLAELRPERPLVVRGDGADTRVARPARLNFLDVTKHSRPQRP